MTRVVSISDILDVFRMVDDDRIDSTNLEPAIDHREIIVAIARVPAMMILSFSCRELDIPVMCCHIES